ncbi:MAG TPA: Xaa-Pro peptidase family protein [Vicinamibacterales bacterium]|nr:Xaa-Pro peptidase family protein [Vicinamibacterales bacterium]
MSQPSRPALSGRLQRFCALPSIRRLDGVVVSTPLNIKYLTGFSGTAGLLVVSARLGHAWLVVDGRYEAAARAGLESGAISPVEVEPVSEGYDDALAALLGRLEFERVGFEPHDITVAQMAGWRAKCPAIEWIALAREVERMRMIKDQIELATLRRAGALLAGVARELREILAARGSERDVARRIDQALERAGFSAPAFPTIVASGPHSAHAHARPTSRELADGDAVLLDFGGVLDGYCVDLSRMAVVGQASDQLLTLFEAVRAAQTAALAAVRPGGLTSDVDAAARQVLTDRGFGAAFVHATGHGLGLDVHEAPRIARAAADQEPLVPGMVFTVEPGAYLEGLCGVRLEDDVVVTATGCEVLTDAPRDLMVV